MIAQNIIPFAAKHRLNWVSAALALPLFGMVAAFGIAPNTRTENVPVRVVEQALALPKTLVEDASSVAVYSRQEMVRRGDTVSALMARMQADDPDAIDFLKTDSTAKSIYRALVPGRVVETRISDEGKLLGLRMRIGGGSVLKVVTIGDELLS